MSASAVRARPRDRTLIQDLHARCLIGVNADEREKRQDVLLTIDLVTDHAAAARSDRLEDALDYRALKKDVLAYVESSAHGLIETLAERVALICLKEPRTHEVTVRVEKPGALRFARTVAVQVTRSRDAP